MTSLRPSTIRVCTSRPSEALRHMSSTKCVFSSGFLLLTILQPLKRQVLVLSDAAGRCRQKIVIALLLMSIHYRRASCLADCFPTLKPCLTAGSNPALSVTMASKAQTMQAVAARMRKLGLGPTAVRQVTAPLRVKKALKKSASFHHVTPQEAALMKRLHDEVVSRRLLHLLVALATQSPSMSSNNIFARRHRWAALWSSMRQNLSSYRKGTRKCCEKSLAKK